MLGKNVRLLACAPLLVAALGLGGCSYVKARGGAGVTLDAGSVKAFYTEQQGIYNELVALSNADGVVDPVERNRRFLRLGYTYVDQKCEAYFNALTVVQRDRRTLSAEAALIGAAAGGIMSAVQASAKAIALVGIGAGFTVASIETVTDGVLYDLDASATRTLTFKALQKYQEGAPAPGDIANFADAVFVLQGYGELCLPPTIEAMVKSAVKSANPEDLSRSPGRDSFLGAMAQQRADDLAAYLGVSRIGSQALVALYWLYDQGGIEEADVPDELAPSLGSTLAEKLLAKDAQTGKYKPKAEVDIRRIQNRLDSIAELDATARKEAIAARSKHLAQKKNAADEAARQVAEQEKLLAEEQAKAEAQAKAQGLSLSPQAINRLRQDFLVGPTVEQPKASEALPVTPSRRSGLLNRPLIGVR